MAAPRVSRGLSKVQVPVYIGAGIDTKNNPKLVQPGALLELENMYQLRTGELRLRNGFAALTSSPNFTKDNLFPVPGGLLGSVHPGGIDANQLVKDFKKYGGIGPTAAKFWYSSQRRAYQPYPTATAAISGVSAESSFAIALSIPDLVDGTTAVANGFQLTSWIELATGNPNYLLKAVGGVTADAGTFVQFLGTNGRPPVCCSAGTAGNVLFYCDASSPASLKAMNFTFNGYFRASNTTLAASAVSVAQPWIDARPIPGGNLIAVAYRATGGGVSTLVYDASTGTVTTGPVNIAAADATMCLGWMEDSFTTGSLYLATAGGTSGVVVRTLSATTLAVTNTRTISAGATTNVRQVTGHLNTSTTYTVLWELAQSPTYTSTVYRATWDGAAVTSAAFAASFSLYSRSFKAADGLYYFIGAYDSTLQPTYSVIPCDTYDAVNPRVFNSVAQIFSGYAGGRRASVSSLANCATGTNGTLIPVARKQQIATTTGAATGLRAMNMAEVIMGSKFYRPRELGGTLFVPGGIIQRDDGVNSEAATMAFYLETPSLASSATGSMTASGAYAYRCVLKRIDATGRVTRSAGSVVASITLGAGDGQVTLTLQNPRLLPAAWEPYYIEIYRAGPAATGAVNYNKVGEAIPTLFSASDTFTFVDSMSDATAQAGELLYSTGNVLEHFEPPACTLLEVHGPRVWIVSAEDSTQLWYSKEYKPGAGIGFNPALTMRVTGDGYGGITALAAMDGRLIVFKSQAIYVVSGDGPNDLGQGTFNPPQAISLSVGTMLPGSVVSMPDGIMFQGAAGIYLLDRGLGLSYLGKPVEQYTLAENVVDASLVQGINQARFVMASGRCLVWDYDLKTWSTYKLRIDGSTIVACANIPSGWCYALANGTVYQETPGVYSDVNGTSTAIVPRVGFPHLNLAGLSGYQRIYKVEVVFDPIGDHTIALDCEFDYSGAVTGTPRTKAVAAGAASSIVEYNPPEGHAKSTAIRPVLTTSVQAAGSGAFRFTGLAVTVGVKRGSNTPFTKRMT
jgi:hypothetical protein